MQNFSKIKIFLLVILAVFSIFLYKEARAGSTDNVRGWTWSENVGWISLNDNSSSTSYLSWSLSTGIMSGFAWSDNIGWVSFNCDDVNVCSVANQFCSVDADCPGGQTCVNTRDGCALISDYKVSINTTSGELSGYAWSDAIGWLSFNNVDTGDPPATPYNGSETYIAKKVNNKITGWGKFLSAAGSWDGWVKFACYDTECATYDYSFYTTGTDGTSFYGFAWGSDVVGWLAASSGAVEYGVKIDSTAYTLSGYAWSDAVGWLSFNRADTGAPPAAPFNGAESYIAKLDTSTCKLRGWGKFLSAGGGWDGWAKLQREGGTPDYAVTLTDATHEFSGWVWAGSPSSSEGVVGWISTNDKDFDGLAGPVDYQMTTTVSCVSGPTCSSLSVTAPWKSTPGMCLEPYQFSCTASGFDQINGYYYQIQADTNLSECSDTGGENCDLNFDSEVACGGSCSLGGMFLPNTANASYYRPAGSSLPQFKWHNDQLHYWRIRLKNKDGSWGSWTSGSNSFAALAHPYPCPALKCSKTGVETPDSFDNCSDVKIYTYNDIYLRDESTCYDATSGAIAANSASFSCRDNYGVSGTSEYKWNLGENDNIAFRLGMKPPPGEGTNTPPEDSSGGVYNNPTLVNAPTTTDCHGQFGYSDAMCFVRTSQQYMKVCNPVSIPSGSSVKGTIEARFKIDSMPVTGEHYQIMAWGNPVTSYHAFGTAIAHSAIEVLWGGSAPPTTVDVGDISGSWHYLVVMYDGTTTPRTAKIFLDGELKKTENIADTISIDTTGCDVAFCNAEGYPGSCPIFIGGVPNGEWFNGKIDEVTILNRTLDLEEIQNRNGAGPVVRTEKLPKYKYSQKGVKTLKIRINDKRSPDEYSDLEEEITVERYIKWREINPFE